MGIPRGEILRLGPVRLFLKNVAIGNVGNVAWDPAGTRCAAEASIRQAKERHSHYGVTGSTRWSWVRLSWFNERRFASIRRRRRLPTASNTVTSLASIVTVPVVKNMGASVRQRLLNYAKASGLCGSASVYAMQNIRISYGAGVGPMIALSNELSGS